MTGSLLAMSRLTSSQDPGQNAKFTAPEHLSAYSSSIWTANSRIADSSQVDSTTGVASASHSLQHRSGAVTISRQAILQELLGNGRCLECQARGRRCYVEEGATACLQCTLPENCFFERHVLKKGRLSDFSWNDVIGGPNHVPVGAFGIAGSPRPTPQDALLQIEPRQLQPDYQNPVLGHQLSSSAPHYPTPTSLESSPRFVPPSTLPRATFNPPGEGLDHGSSTRSDDSVGWLSRATFDDPLRCMECGYRAKTKSDLRWARLPRTSIANTVSILTILQETPCAS